jgi:hypothetical protein
MALLGVALSGMWLRLISLIVLWFSPTLTLQFFCLSRLFQFLEGVARPIVLGVK